jgi:threonine dehydratase
MRTTAYGVVLMPKPEDLRVSLSDIEGARRQIQGIAWKTPLVPASRDEDGILLKLECVQRTGSFKIRGAWNRMSRVGQSERARGFVTVSAGNHGQAVAWSARRLGSSCTVYVPETAVARKVDAIRSMGAEIRRLPHDEIMESMVGDKFAKDPKVFIHPFGDKHIIAGQGTIGLEVLDEVPDVGSVLVPVGGGGLAYGIATAVKALRPNAKVFGVQAAAAAPLDRSWKSGKPERTQTPTTIADGIGASMVFDYMFPHLRATLDGVLTVSEEELRQAVRRLASDSHVVAEAAGAASLAAALKHATKLPRPIVCIVSGGNVAPALLREVLDA